MGRIPHAVTTVAPRVRRAVLVAGLALLAPTAAQAGVLDQKQESGPVTAHINGPDASGVSRAQTFTAGKTGLLDQVDLLLIQNLGNTGQGLTVEIRNVVAGAPGGSADVLASASIPAASIPPFSSGSLAFVAVTFSPPALVFTGTQYAIVAYTSGAAQYIWGFNPFNPYLRGAAFVSLASPLASWTQFSTDDQAFRTYVNQDAHAIEAVCNAAQDNNGDGDTANALEAACEAMENASQGGN